MHPNERQAIIDSHDKFSDSHLEVVKGVNQDYIEYYMARNTIINEIQERRRAWIPIKGDFFRFMPGTGLNNANIWFCTGAHHLNIIYLTCVTTPTITMSWVNITEHRFQKVSMVEKVEGV